MYINEHIRQCIIEMARTAPPYQFLHSCYKCIFTFYKFYCCSCSQLRTLPQQEQAEQISRCFILSAEWQQATCCSVSPTPCCGCCGYCHSRVRGVTRGWRGTRCRAPWPRRTCAPQQQRKSQLKHCHKTGCFHLTFPTTAAR